MRQLALAVVLSGLSAAATGAQEIAIHGVAAPNMQGGRLGKGIGGSLSGTLRIGTVFGADAGALQHSNRRLGFRISLNDFWYTREERPICADGSPCPTSRFQQHFVVTEGSMFVLPYDSRRTRVELGGGLAVADVSFALSGALSISRRLTPTGPSWAMLAWQPRKWFQAHMADAPRAARPAHSFSAGLSVRAPTVTP
jgi:hypothetical protein